MSKKVEVVTVALLYAGDVLPDYDLTYVGRNYVPEPNYEGKTNSLGNWVGEPPVNVWRYEFRDRYQRPAYLFPHSAKLHRVDAGGKPECVENFPEEFRYINNQPEYAPTLMRSKGK